MKTKLILIITLLAGFISYGQQDPQYTQYMYNTVKVNPAYAGSRENLSIFGMHRSQWVGLDGAPVTNSVSAHAPTGKNVGIGISFVNDRIGPMDENTLSADFSYTLETSYDWKLALGLKATANLLSVDFTKLNIYNSSDPRFQNNIDNQFSPNFGLGAYWYSEYAYLGFSVPNILETKRYNDNDLSVLKENIHYYLIGGYVFDIAYNIQFKPAFMTKVVNGAPLQVDLSANFLFSEKFTAGLAYRWDAALSALVGFQITESLFAGYTYDMETTRLANYNSGSHEIFLRFEVFSNSNKVVNPRFF